jgi:hypothetical protein
MPHFSSVCTRFLVSSIFSSGYPSGLSVTTVLRLMRPPVRSPRLRCALFPLIYLPHLLVLPATFKLQRFEPTYPYFPALYVVPVRQAKGLLAASFRFHLTMDTLAVRLCTSSLPTRTRDFHPLERAHGAQTQKSPNHKGSELCRVSKLVEGLTS